MRYRRCLPGPRSLLVVPARDQGWTWDLWGACGIGLLGAVRMYRTAQAAKSAASRAATGARRWTDSELIGRNGVEDFPESLLLSITAVSAGESCGLCRQPVPAGLAAKDADGWLVCAECACRVPRAAMAK